MTLYGSNAASVPSSECHERARTPYRARTGTSAWRPARVAPAGSASSINASPTPAPSAAAPPLPRTEATARQADALARSLCAARERLTVPLALLAASLALERAWCTLGFARAADFARECLGRSGRWLRDLATLHRALSDFDGLSGALTGDDGGAPLGRRRALLVARVATASTLRSWIALARRLTVRELHAEVVRALGASEASPEGAASAPAEDASAPAPRNLAAGVDVVDDFEDHALVRLEVPRAVLAAFDEALDLYRALEGSETTVTSFVESLVAEASSGGAPGAPDADSDCPASGETHCAPTAGGSAPAHVEAALARSTDRWRHLPRSTDPSWGLALGRSTLARLAALVRAGGEGTAAERVGRMKELLAIENDIEIHLGRLLATMGEQGAWERLRFAGMAHYAEERLGLSRTTAQSRARAARALGCFPLVRAAYEDDSFGLEAALLVARVLSSVAPADAVPRATPCVRSPADLESTWVRHASEVTLKRLRDEERSLNRFAAFLPGSGSRAASVPAGGAAPTATASLPPGDAEWHASLRREPGAARRRVAALGLVALGARIAGPALDHEAAGATFDPSTALIPQPDVFLRLTLPDDLAARFLAAIETARRDLTARAESIPWDAEWPASDGLAVTPALLAARTFSIRSRRVPAWAGLLVLIEDFVATWDPDEDAAFDAADRRRAASRESDILVRDGWRCAAPGCSSRRNLEVHHVRYRSRGGKDDEWNLVVLCRFHHQRGEHGGLARCEGLAPLGLTWRLGVASAAIWYRNDRRIAPPAMPDRLGDTGC